MAIQQQLQCVSSRWWLRFLLHELPQWRRVEEEHRDEGINDLSNCLGCHPGGQEGDDFNSQVGAGGWGIG